MREATIADIRNLDHQEVLRWLIQEYDAIFRIPALEYEYNPPKTVQVLERWPNETIRAYVITMQARTMAGWFGAKTVYAQEKGRIDGSLKREQSITLFDADGNLAWVTIQPEISTYRCALNAMMAIQKCMPDLNSQDGVFLAGYGYIGKWIKYLLEHIFGIRRFIIHTKRGGFQKTDPKLSVEDCRLAVSATTCTTREEARSVHDFPGTQLFVSLDGGYYFGSGFMSLSKTMYSDFPTQLHHHVEEEFPWKGAGEVAQFDTLVKASPVKGADVVCVFLHGIALSDIVAAAAVYKHIRGD